MMIKEFIKRHLPIIVSLKRRVQFGVPLVLMRMKAARIQRLLQHRVAKISKKKTIRVAFLILSDAEFQLEGVFRLMQKDASFDPFIVVIPSMNWEGADWKESLAKNFKSLRNKFGACVINSWDGSQFIELVGACDLCATMNPYDWHTHEKYRIEYLASHGIPVFHSIYFNDAGGLYVRPFSKQRGLAFLWRFYAEHDEFKGLIEMNHPALAKHSGVRVAGVPKLDMMATCKHLPHERKIILICPHHTIDPEYPLGSGNFVRYCEFFQELPKCYPNIDWVFRPHPLLPSMLSRIAGWTAAQWEDYVRRFCSNSNGQYIPGGSYYEMMVNSDGMIQDCCSFLPEYHCAGHPQCYLMRDRDYIKRTMRKWGEELLSHAYLAYDESDVLKFVDDVVIGGNDFKKEARDRFVSERMRPNYPHVNEWIFNDIKETLGK